MVRLGKLKRVSFSRLKDSPAEVEAKPFGDAASRDGGLVGLGEG
jgi:hypothetical protein